jgi:hypothetical protein
MKNKFVMKTKS